MKIVWDGLLILGKDWDILLGILSAVLLGSGIIFLCLKMLLGDELTLPGYFSLGLGGSLLPLLLGLIPSIFLNSLFRFPAVFLLAPLVFFVGLFLFFKIKGYNWSAQKADVSFLALILILLVSILLRLAFLSRLILPPYFDSITHYEIIKGFSANGGSFILPISTTPNGGYYHLGFHGLAAALALALQADAKDILLVFGQILLAILPLPLFFAVRQETRLDLAGLFAVLLAGWGWGMPAHAVNWGKYPALASLLLFEFVFCLAGFLERPTNRRQWFITVIFVLGVCGAGLIHTRALALIAIVFASRFLAAAWSRLAGRLRAALFLLAAALLIALVVFIRAGSTLGLVFDPYLGNGLGVTLLILGLFPFALKTCPRAVFAVILSLIFFLGCLFVPVINLLPGYEYQTLLDRPYVEMTLFFPLSLLGGLGLAGLLKAFRESGLLLRAASRARWLPGAATALLFAAIIVNTGAKYDFYPSSCCQIFGEADAVAFDWMDKKLPGDAYILIASSRLNVLETSPTVVRSAGSDAGTWIGPLIGRSALSLPFDTDFGQQKTRNRLCRRGITHIYIGGTGQGFDQNQLKGRPDWFEMAFFLPKAQVYRLICP